LTGSVYANQNLKQVPSCRGIDLFINRKRFADMKVNIPAMNLKVFM